MDFLPLPIAGAFEIKLHPRQDERGSFARLFCSNEFRLAGLQKDIVQVNQSTNTAKGTIRGMHFQHPPYAETKIIRCLQGRVFDVIVDLRAGSPTFLKWHAVRLSPADYNMVYIPAGCAHGFQTLEKDSSLLYFHTEFYHPEAEGAFRYDDPALDISWPEPPVNISEKDKSYPLLTDSFKGIII